MAREINPQDTTRAFAFDAWMKAPNPMVTIFKTLDVTNLIKVSRKKNYKFNMLLTYCIGSQHHRQKQNRRSQFLRYSVYG